MYQKPLDEVAAWPAWQLRLLEHYLAREPAPLEKLEHAIARLTAIYVNLHLKEGATPKSVDDYLPYLKAWPDTMSTEEYEQALRDLQ